jgi:eukaryotic-like serine/threonine-protein kinase
MIGTTLGHYRIIEKIGEGGMGVVYRTYDEQLDRDVAIKILPEGVLNNESSRRRFRKEALTLAKLNHPHIESVYEFGSQDGIDFLVLEYVPGPTLADRIKTGPLHEEQVVDFGIQLAAALEDAHEHGIVHRDLKPKNIALTPKGQLKVLDFGLAKLLRPENEASTKDFLSTETVAGTLPYMSPEQLRGQPADARSDIYAAGMILYELATGKHPFERKTGTVLIDAILNSPPPPPGRLRLEISPLLEQTILKCLEKQPENRYQSARELMVDLRRLNTGASSEVLTGDSSLVGYSRRFFVVAIIGIVITTGFFLWRRFLPRPTLNKRVMLAVLPFENLSKDTQQDYFSDGLTEEMISQLGRWQPRRLGVIARTSAAHYKGSTERIDQIGHELGVDYVLEGSVRRDTNRVRITAELVRVTDQTPLWSETYERDLKEVLEVQSEVASRITQSLALELLPSQRDSLLRAPTQVSAAHEAYLKGLFYMNNITSENYEHARDCFEEAVRLDPNYAPAYAGLARYYWSTDKLPPEVAMPKAESYALKSLQLDESLPEAHTALAGIRFFYDWDWSAAEKEFLRSLELNPSGAETHRLYAFYLASLGSVDQAVREVRTAQQLDPLSVNINTSAGWVFNYTHQYDQAIEQCRIALETDPDYASAHDCLGEAYLAKGELDRAAEECLRAAASGDPVHMVGLARVYATMGKRSEAKKILDELTTSSRSNYFPPYLLAMIHIALGENEKALFLLEEAYRQRDPYLVHLRKEVAFDPLRSNPRFQYLIDHLRFPQ